MGGVAPAIASPCTGVCRLDAAGERCRGCARTIDEIARWPTMSAAERAGVTAALARRHPAAAAAGG